MKNKKIISILISVILILVLLVMTSCGASNKSMTDSRAPGMNSSEFAPSQNGVYKADDNVLSKPDGTSARMIAYSYYYSIKVDDVKIAHKAIVDALPKEGWVQGEDFSENYGEVTVRIATNQIDTFLNQIEGVGTLKSHNVSSTDYTDSYQNADERKQILETEKSRLVELYNNATVSDMIEINRRLAEIDMNLRSLNGELKNYEQLCDYSVVRVRIFSDKEYYGPTFGERFIEAISNGWNALGGVFFFLIRAIIVLVPIGLVVWLIVRSIIKYRKTHCVDRKIRKIKNQENNKDGNQ